MRWSNRSVPLLLLTLVSVPVWVPGCVSPTSQHESSGSAQWALTGTSASGAPYRLRNATIQIDGPTTTSVNTEDGLAQGSVSVELKAGSYVATLSGNWSLERGTQDVTGRTTFSTVKANLISPNPMSFDVQDQITTHASFQFGVGEGVVALGNGRAVIGFGVSDCSDPAVSCPGDAGLPAQCDILEQTGCPSGQSCYFTNDTSGFECQPTGFAALLSNCFAQDDCPSRAVCAPNGLNIPGLGMCSHACNVMTQQGCGTTETCTPVFFSATVGICTSLCPLGLPEVCGDGKDNNCDGRVDECCTDTSTCPTQCDFVAQTGCIQGQSCYMRDDGKATFCAPTGSGPEGAPGCLSQSDCAPPSFCIPAAPFHSSVCARGCNLATQQGCGTGQTCTVYEVGSTTIGLCDPIPGL